MTRKVKNNNIFYPGIDTNHDELGIAEEFSMEITDAITNEIVDNMINDAEFYEILMSFEEHSAEVAEDSIKGINKFIIKNSSLVWGDSIKINEMYYIISSIQDNIVTIKGHLKEDIFKDTIIDSCGNTGIYKIPVKLNSPGLYFCTIFHKKFGHIAAKYNITSIDEEDIMDEVNNIKIKIDSLKHNSFI